MWPRLLRLYLCGCHHSRPYSDDDLTSIAIRLRMLFQLPCWFLFDDLLTQWFELSLLTWGHSTLHDINKSFISTFQIHCSYKQSCLNSLCCLMYLLRMLTAERGQKWESLLKDADTNPSFILSAESLRKLIKAGSRISVLTFLQSIQIQPPTFQCGLSDHLGLEKNKDMRYEHDLNLMSAIYRKKKSRSDNCLAFYLVDIFLWHW